MNKSLIAAVASLALTLNHGWSTAGTYTVLSGQTVTIPPVVDATNFVNLGLFTIGTITPFDFSNVQNFTNRNYMDNLSSGFIFNTSPSGTGMGSPKMARSFYNAPMVPSGSATIYGGTHVLVSATNIVSRGLLEVGTSGLISLEGQKVDVSRSLLQVDSPQSTEGILDQYRNFGTNRLTPAANFISAPPSGTTGPNTPVYQVIRPRNVTNSMSLLLNDVNLGAPPSVTGTEFTYEQGTNRTVQIVFVRNPNTNVFVQVESVGGSPTDLGTITIQWATVATNTSGQPYLNALYLTDTYGFNTTNVYTTNASGSTLHPANFSLSRAGTFGTGDVGVPFTDKPPEFWGTPTVVTNGRYSAYGALVSPGTSVETGQNARQTGGRIEINAKDSLDLSYTRIEAYGYLKLQATNHFTGAASSTVAAISPYADINLGSTNGYMQIKGLVPPSVARISGTIDAYTVVWTNTVAVGGETNSVLFNVLMVDAFINDQVAPEVFTLGLRSTNVVIGDTLNVSSNLQLQASSLTLDAGATLNVGPGTAAWSAAAPGLQTLTNRGTFFFYGDLDFVGLNTNGTGRPYQTLRNEGTIQAPSVTATAGTLDNLGYLYSYYGPASLVATTNMNLADGGTVFAPYGDINIAARNLSVSNHLLQAGRSINLSVTNSLMAGPNAWTVYDGFNLWVKPATGDLAQVQVYNFATDFQETISTWAGKDFGPVAAGFTNNAALGSLTLDGGLYSLFVFTGTGPSSNALYVDVLYLVNSATNRDMAGNLTSVSFNPGMKIYFSQAFMDDGLGNYTEVTSELGGKNGGAFGQVTHAGPLSLPIPIVTSSPAIKVVVERSPQLRALVSWNTPAKATNYLYYVTNPYSGNWQLLTNFVSGATGSSITVVDPGLSSSRFYRAKVDAPAY